MSVDLCLIASVLLVIESILSLLPLRRQSDSATVRMRDAVRADLWGREKQKPTLTHPNFSFIIEFVRCQ